MKESGLDAVLNLLAAGDRRVIVDVLRQQATGDTTIDDLADRLAADGQVPENDRERLSIKLYHTHLPKLEDHGLVEFDPQRGTVRYQPTEPAERVIEALPDPGRSDIQSWTAD